MSIIEKKQRMLENKIKQKEKLEVDILKLRAQLAEPERTERNYQKYRQKYLGKKTNVKTVEEKKEIKKSFLDELFE